LIFGCDASPFYTVRIGDEAIVTQNGKIVGNPKKPGLHFKIPFFQKVHLMQLHRVRFLSLPVPKSNSLEAKIMWTVQDSKKFFLAKQKGNISDIIKTTVTPKLNEIFSEYDLKSIVLISREQHNDPEYIRILKYVQEPVIDFGVRIFGILFEFNQK
jgi:regulator of protease activity HflC (stomatin/prohibitin superfamily)